MQLVLLAIACVTPLLHIVDAHINDVFNCTIDSNEDDIVTNSSQCEAWGAWGKCTLRNAIEFCNDHLQNNIAHTCSVFFPSDQTLVLNGTYGDLVLWRTVGTLVLEGNGCAITSHGHSGNRFLTMFDPASVAGQLDFHMSDLHISHFGNESIVGGALLMRDTRGSSFHNVTFAHNLAEFGGAVSLERNENTSFVNVTFIGNAAVGDAGAVRLSRNNDGIKFQHCRFLGNYALGSNNDENPGRGGAIFLDTINDNILVADSLFERNFALRGASLCLNDRNVGVSFLRTVFQHNIAELHSGGVYAIYDNTDMTFVESTFFNNEAGDGPAVRLWSGNDRFAVRGCNFTNNRASSEGGAIFVYSDNRGLSFEHSTFAGNSAVVSGGALYVDSGNSGFIFDDCVFAGNSAERGGGMYVGSVNGDFKFTRVTFEGNIAEGYGGGISFVSLNSQIKFDNSTFTGNAAYSGGGVHLAMENTQILSQRTNFLGNRADLYGGGIYMGQEQETFLLLDSVVAENRADSGGGVYIGQFNFGIVLRGSDVSRNVALGEGGGIFSLAYEMEMYDSLVTRNWAHSSAGMHLTFGDKSSPVARLLILADITVSDNVASLFGGVSIMYGSNLDIRGCLFQNNSADVYDSGGLSIRESSNCSLEECTFWRNYAGMMGGALFMKDSSGVQLYNIKFVENKAEVGGAAYFEGIVESNMSGSRFVNNSARENGGGLWLDNSDIEVMTTQFESNVAVAGSGAAIYASFSSVAVLMSEFSDNSADQGAGAVFWRYHSDMTEPSGLRSGSNVFQRNEALYGNDWATEGIHVVLSNTTLVISDYTAVAPTVLTFISDFYNQTVRTDSLVYVEVENLFVDNCYGTSGYVSGDVIERVENGVASFSNLLPSCAPGFAMDISFTASIPATQAVLTIEFRGCETGEYYGERICQPCPNGSYSFVDPTGKDLDELSSSICEECPYQASHCYKDTILLKEGFWRISETSHDVLTCPLDAESCVGGPEHGNSLCGEGYTDTLCAVCDSGYTLQSSSQTCEECSSDRVKFSPFLFIFVLLILLVAAFVFISWKQVGNVKSFDQFVYVMLLRMGIKKATQDTERGKEIQNLREIRLTMQTRLSIYGTFFQIIAVLPYVLDQNLPVSFSTLLHGLGNVLNLSVSQSPILSCDVSEDYDFIDSLLVDTLMPLVVLVVLVVAHRIHSVYLSYQEKQQGTRDTDLKNVIRRNKVRSGYVKFFLIYSVIILPYVSVQIFKTFSCQDVDADDNKSGADHFLRTDYSISCTSARYDFARAWATSAIIIYIVILPGYYLFLLSQAKTEIARFNASDIGVEEIIVSDKLQPIYFLFRKYKTQFWYWEVIELYFRVSITGFLVLLRPGSFQQVEVGFLVIFLYAKLFQLCDPYKHKKLQALKAITLWQLFFMFHVVYLIRGDEMDMKGDRTAVMLYFISFFCLAFDMMLALLQYLSRKHPFFAKVVGLLPAYLFPASNYLSEFQNTEALQRGIKEFQSEVEKSTVRHPRTSRSSVIEMSETLSPIGNRDAEKESI